MYTSAVTPYSWIIFEWLMIARPFWQCSFFLLSHLDMVTLSCTLNIAFHKQDEAPDFPPFAYTLIDPLFAQFFAFWSVPSFIEEPFPLLPRRSPAFMIFYLIHALFSTTLPRTLPLLTVCWGEWVMSLWWFLSLFYGYSSLFFLGSSCGSRSAVFFFFVEIPLSKSFLSPQHDLSPFFFFLLSVSPCLRLVRWTTMFRPLFVL